MKLTGHTFLTLAGECAGSRRSSIRARRAALAVVCTGSPAVRAAASRPAE